MRDKQLIIAEALYERARAVEKDIVHWARRANSPFLVEDCRTMYLRWEFEDRAKLAEFESLFNEYGMVPITKRMIRGE